jgi:hypothetical protein
VADRGAARAAVRRPGRTDVADAAVSDEAGGVRPAGLQRGRPDRLHAGDPAPRRSRRSRDLRIGPMFTPPSLVDADDGTRGTLVLPHFGGGTNWEGGAPTRRPACSTSAPSRARRVLGFAEPDPATDMRYVFAAAGAAADGSAAVKPPWGRITAIDMNTGEHAVDVAERRHAGLRREIIRRSRVVDSADRQARTRPALLVTKTLLFAGEGWNGDPILRAYDKATGEVSPRSSCPGRPRASR